MSLTPWKRDILLIDLLYTVHTWHSDYEYTNTNNFTDKQRTSNRFTLWHLRATYKHHRHTYVPSWGGTCAHGSNIKPISNIELWVGCRRQLTLDVWRSQATSQLPPHKSARESSPIPASGWWGGPARGSGWGRKLTRFRFTFALRAAR